MDDGGGAVGADLSIRPLEEKDIDELVEMERRCFDDPWTRGQFLQELASPQALSSFYVMLSGDLLVAYGGFWVQFDEAHVTNLAVREGWRRRGVGGRMLAYLLKEAAGRGLGAALLEVRPSNAAAIRLYKRFGFRRVAVRSRYYARTGEDAVVMMADLGPFA